MLNSMGPRIDSYGTLWDRVQELKVVSIVTLCNLSCRYLSYTSYASKENP